MTTTPQNKKPKELLEWFVVILVVVIFIIFVILRQPKNNFSLSSFFEYKALLKIGVIMTLKTTFISFILSTLFGLLLFLMDESRFGILKKLTSCITEVAMGTPLLVLIIINVFFIGKSFGIGSPLVKGILAITFYSGPYIYNIFSGAVKSIDPNQFLLMDFYNFNTFQRYYYVIFPQIFKQIMPGMIGNLSMIIKGTALLNVVSIPEIFYQIKIIQSKSYAFTEGYMVLWVAYLLITIPLSLLAKYLQKRCS